MSPDPGLVMVLEGGPERFALRIADYEFPDAHNDDWLVIAGEVRLAIGEWSFRDPSLTTFEVARLAGWLEALAAGAPTEDWVDIIEPNIAFERTSPTTIRVSFWIESAPDWAKASGMRPGLSLPIDGRLAVAAAQLREQLAHFPHRGEDD